MNKTVSPVAPNQESREVFNNGEKEVGKELLDNTNVRVAQVEDDQNEDDDTF